jgi:hypothetical protein
MPCAGKTWIQTLSHLPQNSAEKEPDVRLQLLPSVSSFKFDYYNFNDSDVFTAIGDFTLGDGVSRF